MRRNWLFFYTDDVKIINENVWLCKKIKLRVDTAVRFFLFIADTYLKRKGEQKMPLPGKWHVKSKDSASIFMENTLMFFTLKQRCQASVNMYVRSPSGIVNVKGTQDK